MLFELSAESQYGIDFVGYSRRLWVSEKMLASECSLVIFGNESENT